MTSWFHGGFKGDVFTKQWFENEHGLFQPNEAGGGFACYLVPTSQPKPWLWLSTPSPSVQPRLAASQWQTHQAFCQSSEVATPWVVLGTLKRRAPHHSSTMTGVCRCGGILGNSAPHWYCKVKRGSIGVMSCFNDPNNHTLPFYKSILIL